MTYSPEYRRILNKLGYYNYQNGLIYRHLNQEGGWDEHLRRCREYVLIAVSEIKPEKVTILGSGWLLDLPLAELCDKKIAVDLVDIVHPPEVARQVREFENVRVIEADATGGLVEEIWKKAGTRFLFRKLDPPEINVPLFQPESDPGFVVSLNLLTQLEYLPVEYLRKKTKAREEELTELRKVIQESHINFLKKNKSVLITDTEEVVYAGNDEPHAAATVLVRIPEGENRQEWEWSFDMKGSDYHNRKSKMKVTAVTYR